MIVWGPPDEANGEITGYQVRFIGTFSRTRTVFKGPFSSYHVVTDSDTSNLGSTIQVQVICAMIYLCVYFDDNFCIKVRARTSAGFGLSSSSITYTGEESAIQLV